MKFRNMSLWSKLIGGFATVIVLLIVVSLVGFNALNHASSGFTQYREMARDANLSGRLQANMLMVRMNVKDFIITGSEKDKQQYQEYLQKMDGFLESAQKEINAPERARKIDEVNAAHLKYDEAFKEVVAFRDQRNHLVKDVLDVRGPLMEKKLTRIMESAQQDGDMTAAFNSGIAMKHLLLARVYMAKFLDTNQQAAADRVLTEFGKMTDYLKILDRELQNPDHRKMLATVKTAETEYVTAFNRVVNVIFERNTIIRDTLDKIGPQIAGLVEEVKLDIKGAQDEIGPMLQAANQKAVTSIVIVSVVALLAGIALVFFTTRSVTTQLGGDPSEIADVARHISQGNLVIDFKSNRDGSTTGVYHDMETMTANLKQMFTDINAGVETLTASATELSAISEQMTQGVQVASDKSTTVSVASEEMTANMNTVAAAMEQSATNTNMVATASEEMSATIGEIAQNAEKARVISDEAAHKASSASENMDQLGNAANAIGKVIETITDISEQVNLLALNATIEAARAGEAGKGFAVVANEIKELAKQTAAATQDIKEKIEGIQGTTSTTVDQISEINQVISDVHNVVINIATSVEQQSAATKEIADNVAQASSGIQEVNENVNQSSSVSAEISQDITGVSSSMNEMANSSSQVNLSAQELSKLSENLKQMVEQFKI